MARLLVGDRETAEDIVQEAFARCLDRWWSSGSDGDPMAYLWTSVVNLSRSRLRSRSVRTRAFPRVRSAEPDDPGLVAVAADEQEAMRAAVARLPRRQREVVALRFYVGCSVAETADALDIRPGTVKAHTHQAIETLRRAWEEQ
jgi:RNA polymerase sigma factor (sigma-70 family)